MTIRLQLHGIHAIPQEIILEMECHFRKSGGLVEPYLGCYSTLMESVILELKSFNMGAMIPIWNKLVPVEVKFGRLRDLLRPWPHFLS